MINRQAFMEKYMNFKMHFDKGSVRIKSLNDEEFDLEAVCQRCLIVNPCFPNK